ncbi:MAG: 50S ribosomal protein L11 methyltransferase [Desulfobacterales bacterium]|nr:MAG: 50S ribosomal protein L11 methyltransferase [Desulfobacterales bacterium]
MKWIETKVAFSHPDRDLAGDLIANIFFDLGLRGVVVEDPDLEPAEDWAEEAGARPDQPAVIGYFACDDQAEERCKVLAARLAQLQTAIGVGSRISYKELDEEDWAESWKAYFWPQKISRRIVVKPTWRQYQAAPHEIVLELDPGMAFGTGTHPTTVLCVELIEAYLEKGFSVLDVGTGSGILMVAASKLGAGRVYGIDHDKTAVEIAARNLALNRIDARDFQVVQGDLVKGVHRKFDLVVANILTHVILDLLDSITRVVKVGGIFACSGIITENEARVVSHMQAVGFEILDIRRKENWVAIAGRLAAPVPSA